jgi:hypothetical protein
MKRVGNPAAFVLAASARIDARAPSLSPAASTTR